MHDAVGSLFKVDGNVAYPTAHVGGPWDGRAQHGGAPAALIAWIAERNLGARDNRISRLTLDLVRPVPIEPLTIETEVLRDGRKIRLSEIRLKVGQTNVVRATVLESRVKPTELPESAVTESQKHPHVGASRPPTAVSEATSPFLEGVSMRIATGEFGVPGPKAIWYRVDREVVAGEPISPLMRAAIAADFNNGTSTPVDIREWTFINADMTLNLARAPAGKWILLDGQSWYSVDGRGIAFAKLADENGYFGHSIQSLLVEKR